MTTELDKTVQQGALQQPAKRGRQDVYEDESSTGSSSEIMIILQTLSSKFDALSDTMSGNDTRLNKKIDNLEAAVTKQINDCKVEMDERIQTVSKDFDARIEKAMVDAKAKCDSNRSGTMNVMSQRFEEIRTYHESRLDKLERYSLEKDIVISGVPMENNDDTFAIIGDICNALNCNLKQGDFVSSFRLKSSRGNSKNSHNVPIVARLQDDWAKQELLTAYFAKKNLNLADKV